MSQRSRLVRHSLSRVPLALWARWYARSVKIHGAKVIGIAGTDEKCRWLREGIKIDAALNHKSPTFHDEFKDAVGSLDVFFDNVGGEIW